VLRWDDPALGIDWKLPAGEVLLAARDQNGKSLAEAVVFE
jgi:dTDP-4-dehydrorhamnose 3,5-epimerase-like enzyme